MVDDVVCQSIKNKRKEIEMKKLILGILMLAMCGNSLVYQSGEKYTSENVKANRIDVYRE